MVVFRQLMVRLPGDIVGTVLENAFHNSDRAPGFIRPTAERQNYQAAEFLSQFRELFQSRNLIGTNPVDFPGKKCLRRERRSFLKNSVHEARNRHC